MKGFSLLQLIIVIAIISIIAGTLSFKYSASLDNVKLTAVTKAISEDLRSLQIKAMAKGADLEVVFSKDSYTIDGQEKKLPSSVEIVNPQTVKFSANLTPVPTYFGTITLRASEKTKKIIISSLGRIRVE